jgi:hypothetical protein
MNEEEIAPKIPSPRRWRWITRGALWVIVILAFSILSGCTLLFETPVHFVLGWYFHATKTLPPLLENWHLLLGPLGCLVLGTWLVHRFVLWWQLAKGKNPSWQFVHTLSGVALLLLGSGAAIALSGVVHQSIWLMSDPWTENRGRRHELVMAMGKARQLMMALNDFHLMKNRYPNNFEELESEMQVPREIIWVPANNGVSEPFILLHPGGDRFLSSDEPVIVSPVIQRSGKIVVGNGDGSVKMLPTEQLGKVFKSSRLASPQPMPAHE